MRIRINETQTLVLLADFDSDFVPRVGEYVEIRPELNVGDIHNDLVTWRRVLTIAYQAAYKCVHLEVDAEGNEILPFNGDLAIGMESQRRTDAEILEDVVLLADEEVVVILGDDDESAKN
ncbi:MAG: hypothetical protein ABIQ73_07415 [Acidimicrobiales bacterium]